MSRELKVKTKSQGKGNSELNLRLPGLPVVCPHYVVQSPPILKKTSNEDFLIQKPTIDVTKSLIDAVTLCGKTSRGEGGEVDSFS